MTHWHTTPKGRQRHTEHDLQTACVRWFRYTHQSLALCLFAVPNGGARDRTTGAMLKAEGATAGVADLLLLAPSHDGQHHSLAIEMKTTEKGSVQRETQKAWQQAVEATGNRYEVCRDFDHFCAIIADYLGETPATGEKTQPRPEKQPKRATLHDTAEELKLFVARKDTDTQ